MNEWHFLIGALIGYAAVQVLSMLLYSKGYVARFNRWLDTRHTK